MEWISIEKELPPMDVKFDIWDNYHKKRLPEHVAFVGFWDEDFRRECLLIKGYSHWMLPTKPLGIN